MGPEKGRAHQEAQKGDGDKRWPSKTRVGRESLRRGNKIDPRAHQLEVW